MKPKIALALILALAAPLSRANIVDKDHFYQTCKSSFPKYLFANEARIGFENIFAYWEKSRYSDKRWLAYILATAYRETAGTMQPVREGLCKSDACSIQAVTNLVNKRNITPNYALPDENGKSYFGRGYVQLTSKKNYEKISVALGWGADLINDPGLALDPEKSVIILVEGMIKGLFTRKNLGNYFGDKSDWVGARKIVNPGSSRAEITAGYGEKFYDCLK